jgi:hypothetical protein
MDLPLVQTMVIIALISFILGIILGTMLTRPRVVRRHPGTRWEE